MNVDDKRFALLLAKFAAGKHMTEAEQDEYNSMLLKPKPKRIPWGSPGSKVARKLPSNVFSAGAKREIVVSLYPDGVIGMRLAKHSVKSEVQITVSDIFRIASARKMRVEQAKRKAERKAKR